MEDQVGSLQLVYRADDPQTVEEEIRIEDLEEVQQKLEKILDGELMKREVSEFKLKERITSVAEKVNEKLDRFAEALASIQLQLLHLEKGNSTVVAESTLGDDESNRLEADKNSDAPERNDGIGVLHTWKDADDETKCEFSPNPLKFLVSDVVNGVGKWGLSVKSGSEVNLEEIIGSNCNNYSKSCLNSVAIYGDFKENVNEHEVKEVLETDEQRETILVDGESMLNEDFLVEYIQTDVASLGVIIAGETKENKGEKFVEEEVPLESTGNVQTNEDNAAMMNALDDGIPEESSKDEFDDCSLEQSYRIYMLMMRECLDDAHQWEIKKQIYCQQSTVVIVEAVSVSAALQQRFLRRGCCRLFGLYQIRVLSLFYGDNWVQGFKKVDADRWEFSNEGFLGGKKHLLKTIKRRRNLGQSMNQQGGGHSCVELGQFGKEEELEKLRRDRDVLVAEILKLKQQHRSSRERLILIEERVCDSERKQQQITSFVAKTFSNPLFVQQYVDTYGGKENQNHVEIGQKRRLTMKTSMDIFVEAEMESLISAVVLIGETVSDNEVDGPYVVEMANTRELVQQIELEPVKLAHYSGIKVVSIVGNFEKERDLRIRQSWEVVIATPRCILDCWEMRYAVPYQCNYVILDEGALSHESAKVKKRSLLLQPHKMVVGTEYAELLCAPKRKIGHLDCTTLIDLLESRKLTREEDATSDRTIRVFTKLDLVDKGFDALDELEGIGVDENGAAGIIEALKCEDSMNGIFLCMTAAEQQLQQAKIAVSGSSLFGYSTGENLETGIALARDPKFFLVGGVDECYAWLGMDDEYFPYQDQSIIDFVIEHSSDGEEDGFLARHCKLLETWLMEVVFPGFYEVGFELSDYSPLSTATATELLDNVSGVQESVFVDVPDPRAMDMGVREFLMIGVIAAAWSKIDPWGQGSQRGAGIVMI